MAKLKFNFKSIGKNLGTSAKDTGITVGSMLLSRKFIDLGTIFKNQPTLVANQGFIKLGLGLAIMSASKKKMMQHVGLGIALDGAVSVIRKMTAGKDGKPGMFPAVSGQPARMMAQNRSGVGSRYAKIDKSMMWPIPHTAVGKSQRRFDGYNRPGRPMRGSNISPIDDWGTM